MTKAHTPTEMSKGQSDNTNNATKKFEFRGAFNKESVEYTEQQKKRPVNIFLSYLKLKYQKSYLVIMYIHCKCVIVVFGIII